MAYYMTDPADSQIEQIVGICPIINIMLSRKYEQKEGIIDFPSSFINI